MKIEKYNQEITSDMMKLLLTADPNRTSINSYLPESKVLVCRDRDICIGIAVLSISGDVFELKNIAIDVDHRRKGKAKLMIAEVMLLAKKMGAVNLEVGTGNSSFSQLALYQKCGFRMCRIEPGFFESYPEIIYENGIRCIDMVRLRAKL